MRLRILALVLLACPVAVLAESSRLISAEEWARPRDAEAVIAMPAVADAVRSYLASANRRIVILHPKGEEGVVWAEELRAWLVSLGIASEDLRIAPQSTHPDAVEIAVRAGTP